MKKLILSELLLLFLATTFMTDSLPPGWYQQSIPIGNRLITDIYFLDSLNGWVITDWGPAFDTAYVFKTSNGGNNWDFQYRFHGSFTAIQMTDYNTGYVSGSTGSGKIWKTTDGGVNWTIKNSFGINPVNDLFFVNKDTGWACTTDLFAPGIFKTTNGGTNWQYQLTGVTVKKLFFINADTGWAGSNDSKLYRTTNSGQNWNLQYISNISVESIFFLNGQRGWIRGGTGNGVMYTTDGGFNWNNSQGNTAAGFDLRFVNDSIGYSGMQSFRIPKSTDGGKTWGYQNSPIQNNMSTYMFRNDTLLGWAGGTGIVKTTDGGGTIISGIQSLNNSIPYKFKLHQNYPNPFNPSTKIKFDISKSSFVEIKVYDIQGKLVSTLISENLSAGEYEAEFNALGLSSGVYFYQLTISNEQLSKIYVETKKMLMIK